MMTDKNKILRIIGNLLMCIAIVFIIIKLMSYQIDYSFFKNNHIMFIMLLLTCVYMLFIISGCLTWRAIVTEITKEKISFIEIFMVSTKANVLKYIPGNIFQYIGRNELAVIKGISHEKIVLSTLIDVIWNLFSVSILSVLIYWEGIFSWVTYQNISLKGIILILIIFTVMALLIVLIEKIRKQLYNIYIKLKRLRGKSFYICLGKNFILYSILILVYSSITLIIFMILSPTEISFTSIRICIGAILISWIIGFITPGAPGGLGIRETVLIFLLKNTLQEDVILLGAVINRIISIIGDFGALIITRIFFKVSIKLKNRSQV